MMNVAVWWIPAAFVGGAIIGGFVGGYFATGECRKRVKQLEEERKEETEEMSKIMNKYKGKLEEEEKNLDKDILKGLNPKQNKKNQSPKVEDHPFRITEEEFNSDYGTTDDETLTYYRLDSVITDHFDNPIEDPVKLIGKDVWESIDSVEDETIYVHNEELEMNFEIVVNDKLSYYRDVLGS